MLRLGFHRGQFLGHYYLPYIPVNLINISRTTKFITTPTTTQIYLSFETNNLNNSMIAINKELEIIEFITQQRSLLLNPKKYVVLISGKNSDVSWVKEIELEISYGCSLF